MKPLLRFLAVGSLLLATVLAHAAAPFEGKISLAITGEKGRAQEMNYSMKGTKVRMDIDAEGHEMATIMDPVKLEMTMLMPEQKMYMVHQIKPETMEKVKEKAAESSADIEVTGKTETILGYTCNQILIKDKGSVTEAWLAEGLGSFQGLGAPGGGGGMFGGKKSANAAKWEEVLKSKGGFPLRVISRDAKNKQLFKMEATKVEPGPLPDSLFVPPADYQKFQMPGLGGMLKGMGN